MTSRVTIGQYLFQRLKQMGIEHVFSVPGDYSLGLLSLLVRAGSPQWVGTATELGASYAADGYARRRGAGAVLTTFGPGELSAINGIAGSYAERVPVVHIAGTPSTSVMASGAPVHHSLVTGDHSAYLRMYSEVTAAAAQLAAHNACQTIDAVLTASITQSRPAYLGFPEDLVNELADDGGGLVIPLVSAGSPAASQRLRDALWDLRTRLGEPVFVIGHSALNGANYVKMRTLFANGQLPVAALNNGRGAVDEHSPCFVGIYQGKLSRTDVRSRVESAPWRIVVGATLADTTTGGLSHQFEPETTVLIEPERTIVGDESIIVGMTDAVDVLLQEWSGPVSRACAPVLMVTGRAGRNAGLDHPITQLELLECLESGLQEETALCVDVGTAFYG